MEKKEKDDVFYPDFKMYEDQLKNPQMFMAVYAGPEMMSNMGPAAGIAGMYAVSEALKQNDAPAEQKYCSDCGAAIPSAAKFCPDCGKKQPDTCPRCGAETRPAQRFCIECGTVLEKEE